MTTAANVRLWDGQRLVAQGQLNDWMSTPQALYVVDNNEPFVVPWASFNAVEVVK